MCDITGYKQQHRNTNYLSVPVNHQYEEPVVQHTLLSCSRCFQLERVSE
jgi:hypothetical protein